MPRAATFTTFINAKTDNSVESAFSKLQNTAVSRYGTIQRAAEQAARAQAGLLSGRGTAGGGTLTRSLNDQQRALGGVANGYARASSAANGAISSLRREGDQAQRTAKQNEALGRSLRTTATALTVVQGPLGPVAGRVSALANAVEQLTSFRLGLVGVGASLFSIGRLGNNYAVLASRLRPFFDSQEQANAAMNRIVGIATRSRTALEPIVELYTRLTATAGSLGVSQGAIDRVVESASKLATLSGGTAQAREGALVQFSQALGSNFRGSGQELQSLREGAPLILQAIMKGFKNVDGSIGITEGKLRKLAADGELSTQQVIDALARAMPEYERRFLTLPKTLSSATTEFSNAATVMVGRFDQAIGFTNSLATGLSLVANNLRGVTALAITFGGAFAASKALPILTSISDRIRANVETMKVEAAQAATNKAAVVEWAASDVARTQVAERETAARIVALQAEERELDELLAKQRLARAQAVTTVAAARASPTGFAPPTAGSTVGVSSEAAQRRAQAATRELTQTEERARTVKRALAADTALLGRQATEAARAETFFAAETARAVPKVNLLTSGLGVLRSAAGGVMALFGGPWGIALGAATAALYLLATAETAAEAATRKNETAQRDFEAQVDRTTGKIYDQISALQRRTLAAEQGEALQSAVGDVNKRATQLLRQVSPFTGREPQREYRTVNGFRVLTNGQDRRSPEQRELAQLLRNFQSGQRGALPALEEGLVRLAPRITGLAAELPRLGAAARDLRVGIQGGLDSTGRELLGTRRAAARARIADGRARAGDRAIAFGEDNGLTTNGGAKPRTRAQLAIAAEQRAAQTELQRAKADLKAIRNSGPTQGESEDAYISRLAEARNRVRDLTQAEKERRTQATAGRAAARREEAKDRQGDLAAAAATRDNALGQLYQQGLNPQTAEYKAQRDAILTTYDAEVAKIRGLRNEHTSLAAAQKADAEATAAYIERMGEKRRDILAQYDRDPRAVDRGRDQMRELNEAVGTVFGGVVAATADNPLGKGLYTQEMADADARRIEDGIRRPLRDVVRDSERQLEINRLILQGRDAEAEALQTAYGLYDAIGQVTEQEYGYLVRNARQNERINDLLNSRQRITSAITGAVDQAREGFEELLVDIQSGKGGDSVKSFLNQMKQQIFRINARALTEKLFAGSDAKVRELLQGKNSVDSAIGRFSDSVGRVESATDRITGAFDRATARLDAASSGVATPVTGAGRAANDNTGPLAAIGGLTSIVASLLPGAGDARAPAGRASGGGVSVDANGDILVTGSRIARAAAAPVGPSGGIGSLPNLPGGRDVARTIFGTVGSGIDRLVDRLKGKRTTDQGTTLNKDGTLATGGTFFRKLGDTFGKALNGAGEGQFASGIAKTLGLKQSSTGAAIGGAVGSFIPIPGGSFIGGLVGGTIGGLLKKPQFGTAGLAMGSDGLVAGSATGRGAGQKSAATGLAKSVADGINSIAEQLGAKVTGVPDITIGTYKDKYRVSTTGYDGKLGGQGGKTSSLGIVDFGKDEQAAITFAIQNAISRSVIEGISQASVNILKSGQDLQKALAKATAIEAIPKRLLRLTDPTRAAVTELNAEFSDLIAYLKEGGATAAQFADAQKLYDLERAEAIKQATSQAAAAINSFLADMVGGSSSPLNKLTTYQNAAKQLDTFKADIAAGKIVDQSELLSAARNFQDASRAKNGSGQAFFDDFDALRALLEKARDNAGVTNVTTLPASPFATDSVVQNAIASLSPDFKAATQTQTDILGAKLDSIALGIDKLAVGGGGGSSYGSSVDMLPGFQRQAL